MRKCEGVCVFSGRMSPCVVSYNVRVCHLQYEGLVFSVRVS